MKFLGDVEYPLSFNFRCGGICHVTSDDPQRSMTSQSKNMQYLTERVILKVNIRPNIAKILIFCLCLAKKKLTKLIVNNILTIFLDYRLAFLNPNNTR